MTRYDIALKKLPPPVILAETTIQEQIRKTILAGKFPFEIKDVIVEKNCVFPNLIEVNVIVTSCPNVNFKIENISGITGIQGPPQSIFKTPEFGSNLHKYLNSVFELNQDPQFFEISAVAIPPDPTATFLMAPNGPLEEVS
jgi:hypothetical protein